MNTITIDSITYSKLVRFAKLNNTTVADVVKDSVQVFLKRISHAESAPSTTTYELPSHIKRMRGILSEVESDIDNNDDERFNYIMMKNK